MIEKIYLNGVDWFLLTNGKTEIRSVIGLDVETGESRKPDPKILTDLIFILAKNLKKP